MRVASEGFVHVMAGILTDETVRRLLDGALATFSGQATNSIELLCVSNGNWRLLSRF